MKRYEGVGGVKFMVKMRYVTLEWPLTWDGVCVCGWGGVVNISAIISL